jgi:hypothetical protein
MYVSLKNKQEGYVEMRFPTETESIRIF